jgi:succinate dehydrogenase / fumarate reductase iron-sulfur subunit
MEKQLTLRIRRTSRPEDGESLRGYWQEFHVSIPEESYVLDALEAAWAQDPSLMFRHSCHHASCGSCGMRIQGREGLACITPAFGAGRGGVLRLEPLLNFPVLADLVVDMSALARKLEGVGAHILTQATAGQVRFENCIECGLCISACPIAATSEPYLGPAVLAAAARNIDLPQVRSQVIGENGIWRCHSAFECTQVCPAAVEPASAIMNLRKNLLLSMFNKKKVFGNPKI